MTQTGYSNAIVNAMLSWLKGLARWVLRLFNLSGGISPLKFMANNWKGLLVFFLILGLAADLLIWLIRWRPYWVWFRKKRVIINDKDFFAEEDYVDLDDRAAAGGLKRSVSRAKRDWEDDEFVIRSKTVQKKSAASRKDNTVVPAKTVRQSKSSEQRDVFQDDMFNVNANQKFSDKYEDEVFNVSSLPDAHGNIPVKREARRSDIHNSVKRADPRTAARRPSRSAAGRTARR